MDPSAAAAPDASVAAAPVASDYDFTDLTTGFTPSSINGDQDVLVNSDGHVSPPLIAGIWNGGAFQTVIPANGQSTDNELYDISDSGFITGTVDSQPRRLTTTDFIGEGIGTDFEHGAFVNDEGDALTNGGELATNGAFVLSAYEVAAGSSTRVEIGTGVGPMTTGSDATFACGIADSGLDPRLRRPGGDREDGHLSAAEPGRRGREARLQRSVQQQLDPHGASDVGERDHRRVTRLRWGPRDPRPRRHGDGARCRGRSPRTR